MNKIIFYDNLIRKAVDKHLPMIDWRGYKAQLFQESTLNPKAVSDAGAEGVAQIMPDTWKQFSPGAGFENASPFDPEASIMTGAYYMRYLIEEWDWPRPEIDRWCLALASYNAGLGHLLNAQKYQGNPSLYGEIIEGLPAITGKKSRQTISYVNKILYTYIGNVLTK